MGRSLLKAGSAFKTWARWFDDSALQSLLFEPAHRSVLQQLQSHSPGGGRMLDVGCGTGRLVQAAAQRYSLLVGVDPCVEMLEAAQARAAATRSGHSPRFVCAMAEELPFADGSFEVVTSTLSVRHWDDPVGGMRELVRVLSAAGTLVIADAEVDPVPVPGRCRPVRRPVGQLQLLVVRCGLQVVDGREALVRGPIPAVHVLTARHRR